VSNSQPFFACDSGLLDWTVRIELRNKTPFFATADRSLWMYNQSFQPRKIDSLPTQTWEWRNLECRQPFAYRYFEEILAVLAVPSPRRLALIAMLSTLISRYLIKAYHEPAQHCGMDPGPWNNKTSAFRSRYEIEESSHLAKNNNLNCFQWRQP
jgi:hypothetical protein